MKKAIVTGANGFVGGATLRELLNNGYEVWAIGHQDHFSNVPEDSMVYKISCDLEGMKDLPNKISVGEYDLGCASGGKRTWLPSICLRWQYCGARDGGGGLHAGESPGTGLHLW